ncbi:hypothetical protein WJX81_002959 [Elliptochloris bilobata]|uniref:3-isopropylmalate dehydratase n=1 Tax=Elliptochloris bilobata TaxID=381761 RepID=A0AAW1RRA9_9CHLO
MMYRTANLGHWTVSTQPLALARCALTQRRGAGRRQQRLCVAASSNGSGNSRVIRGKCYITRDNIDTDQIIPAEYLTLVPSKPEEYEKLGSYAMIGLPTELYKQRYIEDNKMKTEYPIVIGGENFGCGSSREHAPVALGASGAKVVVAQSFARIFFRNCVATGELYPCETDVRLCDELETGREVEVDMDRDVLTDVATGKQFLLKPLGEAGPVVDAGGLFEYARQTGMINAA